MWLSFLPLSCSLPSQYKPFAHHYDAMQVLGKVQALASHHPIHGAIVFIYDQGTKLWIQANDSPLKPRRLFPTSNVWGTDMLFCNMALAMAEPPHNWQSSSLPLKSFSVWVPPPRECDYGQHELLLDRYEGQMLNVLFPASCLGNQRLALWGCWNRNCTYYPKARFSSWQRPPGNNNVHKDRQESTPQRWLSVCVFCHFNAFLSLHC